MYVRKIKRKRGVYPAEKYEEFRTFFNAISQYDNVKIALKNTTKKINKISIVYIY